MFWLSRYTLLFCLFLASCQLGSVNIYHHDLQIAVVDDLYEDYFNADTSWNDYFNYGHRYYQTGGQLPSGIEVTNSGRLIGIPRSLGGYNFEVSVYGINLDGSEDWIDSAWYTLFVTQESTNESCPQVDEENVSELYLCLGQIQKATLREGDLINFDVTFFVQQKYRSDYQISTIDYKIVYDPESFEPVSDSLNSSLLKEVANYADASIHFEPAEGELAVSVSAGDKKYLSWSGRLMTLPFRVKKDLSETSYPFVLNILSMDSLKENVDLPEMIDLDGRLDIDDPVVSETGSDNVSENSNSEETSTL